MPSILRGSDPDFNLGHSQQAAHYHASRVCIGSSLGASSGSLAKLPAVASKYPAGQPRASIAPLSVARRSANANASRTVRFTTPRSRINLAEDPVEGQVPADSRQNCCRIFQCSWPNSELKARKAIPKSSLKLFYFAHGACNSGRTSVPPGTGPGGKSSTTGPRADGPPGDEGLLRVRGGDG